MNFINLDFKVNEAITDALNKHTTINNCDDNVICRHYLLSIIDWNKKRYGLELNKEWIGNLPSLRSGLISALRTLNPRNGEVILQTPTYNGFARAISKEGIRMKSIPMLKVNGRWKMDLERLENYLGPETKCLILCNPNNPTGECWTGDELRALGDVCIRHGITILSDEIWCDFVRNGKRYTPFASIGEQYAKCSITFKSASKSFSQISSKVAYYFTNNQELMDAMMTSNGHDIDLKTQDLIAAKTVYQQGAQWLDKINKQLDENFTYLDNYINKKKQLPGIEYTKSESTYVAWLDCNRLKNELVTKELLKARNIKNQNTGHDCLITPETVMSEWIMKNTGILLNAGHTYGVGSDGFMRMNVMVPHKQLKCALDKINSALRAL